MQVGRTEGQHWKSQCHPKERDFRPIPMKHDRTVPSFQATEQAIRLETTTGLIQGDLTLPESARGVVLFAHGSGSSRHSSRNRFVARTLQERGFATLLFDLLTDAEEHVDAVTREHRFDIDLLARRVGLVSDRLREQEGTRDLPVGYFGASTGAAAALVAAADRPEIGAVVSRGGRPDLAGDALPRVQVPTLFIVGSFDASVIRLNEQAFARLDAARLKRLEIVRGASHLFEEPGTLEEAARLAGEWFFAHLDRTGEPPSVADSPRPR
jgi:pimeloyl-ACP methyl ester carboxylesterase